MSLIYNIADSINACARDWQLMIDARFLSLPSALFPRPHGRMARAERTDTSAQNALLTFRLGTLRHVQQATCASRVVCNANPSRTQNAADSSERTGRGIKSDMTRFCLRRAAYAKRNFPPATYRTFHKRRHAVSRCFSVDVFARNGVKCISFDTCR